MKFKSFITTAALSVIAVTSAHAQFLGAISAAPMSVKVGQPIVITANIDVTNVNYCGFVVEFGDGSVADGVSDVKNQGPFTFSHTYAKPGNYHVALGGRNVQNHPNCGGQERAVDVVVTAADKPVAAATAMPAATSACPDKWKLVPKSSNAKTGAFACSAKPGTALPDAKPVCKGDLTYYENGKKGQLGCRP